MFIITFIVVAEADVDKGIRFDDAERSSVTFFRPCFLLHLSPILSINNYHSNRRMHLCVCMGLERSVRFHTATTWLILTLFLTVVVHHDMHGP